MESDDRALLRIALEEAQAGFDEGGKRLMHPTRGLTEFIYIALAPEGRPDLSLVTYIPQRPAYESGS